MATISRKQLHSHTGKVLKRVKNDEIIDITDKGEIIATLMPSAESSFGQLLLSSSIRPAAPKPVDFASLPRVSSNVASAKILGDTRGDQ